MRGERDAQPQNTAQDFGNGWYPNRQPSFSWAPPPSKGAEPQSPPLDRYLGAGPASADSLCTASGLGCRKDCPEADARRASKSGPRGQDGPTAKLGPAPRPPGAAHLEHLGRRRFRFTLEHCRKAEPGLLTRVPEILLTIRPGASGDSPSRPLGPPPPTPRRRR